MAFPSRRGRPKTERTPGADTGTPELVMKRLHCATLEPLDLCLERGIITREQHWCGVHLRWLYTLRYGAPGVRAIDPTHLGGVELKCDDPDWRREREAEYHAAMQLLSRAHLWRDVVDLCVLNLKPFFLVAGKTISYDRAQASASAIARLRDALDLLAGQWGK